MGLLNHFVVLKKLYKLVLGPDSEGVWAEKYKPICIKPDVMEWEP